MDRIEPVEIALIEQRPIVLASEENVADGLHRQVLHDGEMKQIPVGFVTIDQRGVLGEQTAHGLHR